MAKFTFLCYTPEDARFAAWLSRYLRKHGVLVQTASTAAQSAAARERETAATIGHCDTVVVVLSPAAVNAWPVRDQALLAEQSGKKIVTVLRQPCDVPPVLAQHPLIDLTRFGLFWRPQLHRLLAELDVAPETQPRGWAIRLFEMGWAPRPLLWLWLAVALGVGAVMFWRWPQPDAVVGEMPPSVTPVAGPRPTGVIEPVTWEGPHLQATPMDIQVRPQDGKVMVFVPAGDFLLGSRADDVDAGADEQPQRVIYLDAFWIDRTEVSNAQYRLCVEAGGCTPSTETRRMFTGQQQPVVGVNWTQAQTYCRWAGGRLPSEAEWEKAARGADGRIYPWGDAFESHRLNYCDRNCIADWRDFDGNDEYAYTAPVHAFPQGASPYGALNMSGNVWEWTADWYAPDAYRQMEYRNPDGPTAGQQRVIRGGSWLYTGRNLQVTRRQKELPSYQYENIGFRCVVAAN